MASRPLRRSGEKGAPCCTSCPTSCCLTSYRSGLLSLQRPSACCQKRRECCGSLWLCTALTLGLGHNCQDFSNLASRDTISVLCTLTVLQILAHHPDFPSRQDAAELGPAVYQPFSRMLQFALEPLILARTDTTEPPGAAIACLPLKTLQPAAKHESNVGCTAVESVQRAGPMQMQMQSCVTQSSS